MTEKDLRLEYKRETGLEAFREFEIETTIPDVEDKTIAELQESIDIVICPDEIEGFMPYIDWLEEKLCKL